MIDPSRRRRWVSTASTWVEKTVALIQREAGSTKGDERWLVGYDAKRLLDELLMDAEWLASYLNDDDLEDARERAAKVVKRCRDRDLAHKLARVEGRTEAEAAAFMERARRLSA